MPHRGSFKDRMERDFRGVAQACQSLTWGHAQARCAAAASPRSATLHDVAFLVVVFAVKVDAELAAALDGDDHLVPARLAEVGGSGASAISSCFPIEREPHQRAENPDPDSHLNE